MNLQLVGLDAHTRRVRLFPGIPTLPVSVRQRKLSEGQLRRSLTHWHTAELHKIFYGDFFFRIQLGSPLSSKTTPDSPTISLNPLAVAGPKPEE